MHVGDAMLYVGDLMSTGLFTLKKTDSLRAARSLMQLARIRHIPIVDAKGDFQGLLTHRDILSATISRFADVDEAVQNEIDSGIPVGEIMRTDVVCVHPGTLLRDAAELLLHHKYGCLPVTEDNRLVGIVTEADFLKLTISLLDAVEHP